MGAINTFNNEFAYWTAIGQQDGHVGARAQAFAKHLDNKKTKIHTRLESLSDLKNDEIVRLVDDLHDRLAALWNEDGFKGPSFPQHRMENLFRIIGRAFLTKAKNGLRIGMFESSFAKLNQAVSSASVAIEKWCETSANVTEHEWNRWEGKYEDPDLGSMLERLGEVLKVRALYEELLKIFPREAQTRFGLKSFSKAFESVDCTNTEEFMQNRWKVSFFLGVLESFLLT